MVALLGLVAGVSAGKPRASGAADASVEIIWGTNPTRCLEGQLQ